MVIQDALDEIKVIQKKIDKKLEFIKDNTFRHGGSYDPYAEEGGTAEIIKRERQAINDLFLRKTALRTAVNSANLQHKATVGYRTKTLAGWIVWEREIKNYERNVLNNLLSYVRGAKALGKQQEWTLVENAHGADQYTIHLDEYELMTEFNQWLDMEAGVQSALSKAAATVEIDIEE